MPPKRPISPNRKRSTSPVPSNKRLKTIRSPSPPRPKVKSGNALSTTKKGISPPTSSSSTTNSSTATKSATQNKPKTTGVMDYLRKALSRDALLGLYSDEKRGRYVCRAVLQKLPETSQQIIVRLSCTGGEFSLAMIRIWLKGTDIGEGKSGTSPMSRLLTRQLNEMYHWAIVSEKQAQPDDNNNSTMTTPTSDTIIKLTPEFYKGLKDSLHSLDASPWNALTEDQMKYLEKEANKDNTTGRGMVKFPAMTPEDLERHTQSQWDAVLHYLVGTPNMKVQPNPAVTHFLFQTDLMQPDPDYRRSYNKDDAPLVITQKGYDFMLQDNSQQVWHFIVQYLASMEASKKRDIIQREALLVLVCLSFSRFGECYSTASLTKRGLTIVKDLALFGLIYFKEIGGTSIFYVTRIAMQLVGASSGSSSDDGGGGGSNGGGMWSWSTKTLDEALSHPRPHNSSHLAIIVQTNFQLCAYTTSELHVSMLGLFCEVQSIRRLPNVIFMTITRDSIKGAFNLGIQSQQILRFLEKHAHPKLRQGSGGLGASVSSSPLPGNIVDQICLWDRERSRVTGNNVFLHQPMMPGEFQAVQKYIRDHGFHVWSSERRNEIYIKYGPVERVQKFIQKWRAKAAAAARR